MYKLSFCWNTAMEGDGPLCRKGTELQLKHKYPKQESRKTNCVSRVAKHCFEPSWTYKDFWTSHNLWWQVIPLLLIFFWFLLLYWAKHFLVGLNFQVRLVRGCQFWDFPQHVSQSSCLGEGEKGDTGLPHLQVLPGQPYSHPLLCLLSCKAAAPAELLKL